MVAMGVIAAHSESAPWASLLLTVVLASHLATDHLVYLGGRWLHPRLNRFPRARRRLAGVTDRLATSPAALLGLIPARVLPMGRGAWLAGCGVVGIPWPRFALADLAALTAHLVVWCGLGWWLAGDLARLEATAQSSRVVAMWAAVAAAALVLAWIGWRWRAQWQPATGRAARRLGRSLRQIGRGR